MVKPKDSFKSALKHLPEKKLSWRVDRHIRKMIRQRAFELDGKSPFLFSLRRFAAAPVALLLLLTSTSTYAFYSPSVIQSDLLYPVKSSLEAFLYPEGGTSEERVAFHLWLSDRRYAEVNEILSRKRLEVSLSAIAFAQEDEKVNPLDIVLFDTLSKATQHMEFAFIVTNEIRDVEEVDRVQAQIKERVDHQRKVLKEVQPVLKEVRLKKKAKSKSIKIVKREQNAQNVSEVDTSVFPMLPRSERSVEAFLEDFSPELESDLGAQADPQIMLPKVLPAPFEEASDDGIDDIEELAAFVEDRLSFQESLLDQMNKKVVQARGIGMKNFDVFEDDDELQVVVEEEFLQDKLMKKAFTVHLETQKGLLQEDVEDLEVLIADADVSTLPVEGYEETLDENTDEGSLPVDSESIALEAADTLEVPVVETVETFEEAIVADLQENDDEQVMNEDDPEKLDELLVSDEVMIDVSNDEKPVLKENKLEDKSWLKPCDDQIQKWCSDFSGNSCLPKLHEQCSEISSKKDWDEFLKEGEKKVHDLLQSVQNKEKVQAKQVKIQEIDKMLEKLSHPKPEVLPKPEIGTEPKALPKPEILPEPKTIPELKVEKIEGSVLPLKPVEVKDEERFEVQERKDTEENDRERFED